MLDALALCTSGATGVTAMVCYSSDDISPGRLVVVDAVRTYEAAVVGSVRSRPAK